MLASYPFLLYICIIIVLFYSTLRALPEYVYQVSSTVILATLQANLDNKLIRVSLLHHGTQRLNRVDYFAFAHATLL
jgi:capsule polysaccharide export protein KpsE/RkpR